MHRTINNVPVLAMWEPVKWKYVQPPQLCSSRQVKNAVAFTIISMVYIYIYIYIYTPLFISILGRPYFLHIEVSFLLVDFMITRLRCYPNSQPNVEKQGDHQHYWHYTCSFWPSCVDSGLSKQHSSHQIRFRRIVNFFSKEVLSLCNT